VALADTSAGSAHAAPFYRMGHAVFGVKWRRFHSIGQRRDD
jgi:hypothetical protein